MPSCAALFFELPRSVEQLGQKFGSGVEKRRDCIEELSRIARTICPREERGSVMTAGEYIAAAVLIVLILWGVKGMLTQEKFRL